MANLACMSAHGWEGRCRVMFEACSNPQQLLSDAHWSLEGWRLFTSESCRKLTETAFPGLNMQGQIRQKCYENSLW